MSDEATVEAVEAAMVARMKQAIVLHKPCGCSYSPLGPSTRDVAEAAIAAYESARGDVKADRETVRAILIDDDCWDDGYGMAILLEDVAIDRILALWPGRTEREVKAEALREAADQLDTWEEAQVHIPLGNSAAAYRKYEEAVEMPADWLRNRATALEQGAGE